MSTELDTAFKLGAMDARMQALENDVGEIKQDVKALLARDAQQKGGKATLAAWGTGGVGVGGIIVAALQLWLGQPIQSTGPTPPPIIYQQPAPPPAQPRAHADERVNPATPF